MRKSRKSRKIRKSRKRQGQESGKPLSCKRVVTSVLVSSALEHACSISAIVIRIDYLLLSF